DLGPPFLGIGRLEDLRPVAFRWRARGADRYRDGRRLRHRVRLLQVGEVLTQEVGYLRRRLETFARGLRPEFADDRVRPGGDGRGVSSATRRRTASGVSARNGGWPVHNA